MKTAMEELKGLRDAETCDGTPRNGPTVHALLSFSEYDRATGSNDYQAKPTVEETTLMGKINRLNTGHSEGAFRGRTPPLFTGPNPGTSVAYHEKRVPLALRGSCQPG